MGLTLKREAADYEVLNPGTYQGKCYMVVESGSEVYNGKTSKKLILCWELNAKMKDGRPFSVSKTYTASMHEKSTLVQHLTAWRGRAFTEEELEGFNICKVIGADCLLGLVHNENGRPKVQTIMALPQGTPRLAPVNEIVAIDLDPDKFERDDFAKLPEWIQDIVKRSPEYKALQNPPQYAPPASEVALNSEEQIPF